VGKPGICGDLLHLPAWPEVYHARVEFMRPLQAKPKGRYIYELLLLEGFFRDSRRQIYYFFLSVK
jgi:hypothetical protein